MTPVAWMAGSSMASWGVIAVLAGDAVNPELLAGMLAPLVSATATWVAIERTVRRAAERLTAVMVIGFGVKLVLFGAYVAVMLRLVGLRPVPFVLGFTGYFIALHLMEALFLRRLLSEQAHVKRDVAATD